MSLLGTGRLLGIYVVIAGDWCFAIPFTDMQVFHGRLLFTVSDFFFHIACRSYYFLTFFRVIRFCLVQPIFSFEMVG